MAPERPAESGWRARVWRSVVFIAIVWTVAGSFVLFEVVALTGLDLAVGSAMFDRVTLSNATAESTSCRATAPKLQGRELSSLTAPDLRVTIWLLGLNTGRDAVVRHWNTPDPTMLAGLDRNAQQLAGALGVTPPDRFSPRRVGDAYREFITYIEAAERPTAREIAERHGSAACELYKFAALWGYASLVRAALPGERSVFPAELRHHAQVLALPEHLYRPLTERTPSDRPEQLADTSVQLTEAVTVHLQSPP